MKIQSLNSGDPTVLKLSSDLLIKNREKLNEEQQSSILTSLFSNNLICLHRNQNDYIMKYSINCLIEWSRVDQIYQGLAKYGIEPFEFDSYETIIPIIRRNSELYLYHYQLVSKLESLF